LRSRHIHYFNTNIVGLTEKETAAGFYYEFNFNTNIVGLTVCELSYLMKILAHFNTNIVGLTAKFGISCLVGAL